MHKPSYFDLNQTVAKYVIHPAAQHPIKHPTETGKLNQQNQQTNLQTNQRFAQLAYAHEFKQVEGFDALRLADDWYFVHALQAAGYLELNLEDETAALETAILGYADTHTKLQAFASELKEELQTRLSKPTEEPTEELNEYQSQLSLEKLKANIAKAQKLLARLNWQLADLPAANALEDGWFAELLEKQGVGTVTDKEANEQTSKLLSNRLLKIVELAISEAQRRTQAKQAVYANYQAPGADVSKAIADLAAYFDAEQPERLAWFVTDKEGVRKLSAAEVNRLVSHYLLQRQLSKGLANASSSSSSTPTSPDQWQLIVDSDQILSPNWRYKLNYLLGMLSQKVDFDRKALLDAQTGVKEVRGHSLNAYKAEVFVSTSEFVPLESFKEVDLFDLVGREQIFADAKASQEAKKAEASQADSDFQPHSQFLDLTPRQLSYLALELEPQVFNQAAATFNEVLSTEPTTTQLPACYLCKLKPWQNQLRNAQLSQWELKNKALYSLFVQREAYLPAGSESAQPVLLKLVGNADADATLAVQWQQALQEAEVGKETELGSKEAEAKEKAEPAKASKANTESLSFPLQLDKLPKWQPAKFYHGLAYDLDGQSNLNQSQLRKLCDRLTNCVEIDYTHERLALGGYDYSNAYKAVVVGESLTDSLDYWGLQVSGGYLGKGFDNRFDDKLSALWQAWYQNPASQGFVQMSNMDPQLSMALAYQAVPAAELAQVAHLLVAKLEADQATVSTTASSQAQSLLAQLQALAKPTNAQDSVSHKASSTNLNLANLTSLNRLQNIRKALVDFAQDGQAGDWLVVCQPEVKLADDYNRQLNTIFTRLVFSGENLLVARVEGNVEGNADGNNLVSQALTVTDHNVAELNLNQLDWLSQPYFVIRHDLAVAVVEFLANLAQAGVGSTTAKLAASAASSSASSSVSTAAYSATPSAQSLLADLQLPVSLQVEASDLARASSEQLSQLLSFRKLNQAQRLALIWHRLYQLANADLRQELDAVSAAQILALFDPENSDTSQADLVSPHHSAHKPTHQWSEQARMLLASADSSDL